MSYTNADPKGLPLVSICLATYNKQGMLDESLKSIKSTNKLCPFNYEVIVCDDDPNGSSFEVVKDNGAYYVWNQNNSFSNPSIPRNCAFRLARGEYIIHQSDDIIWQTEDSIEQFAEMLKNSDNLMVFANVLNVNVETREVIETYTGPDRQKSYFFLGGIKKKDLLDYDENYIFPAYDDDNLSDRLAKKGIASLFTQEIVAHHLNHLKGEMANGVDSSVWYYRNMR